MYYTEKVFTLFDGLSINSKPLKLSAGIYKNIFIGGEQIEIRVIIDNKSSNTINHIKVWLEMKGAHVPFPASSWDINSKTRDGHMQHYSQTFNPTCYTRLEYSDIANGCFPLTGDKFYEGLIIYRLPKELRSSDSNMPLVFTRYYVLWIECIIALASNLQLSIPITIKQTNSILDKPNP